MNDNEKRILGNLCLKMVTEASIKIDDLHMKPVAIIPFCIMMLEMTLKVLNESKLNNKEFRDNNPQDLVEDAIINMIAMFKTGFNRDIELFVEDKRKSKEEISKQVDEFLHNLPKKGDKDDNKA